MSILKALWYGNVCPSEQPVQKGSEYANALHKFAQDRELLLSGLSPEVNTIIDDLIDTQLGAAALAERDALILGFRLAMQLTVEGLSNPPVLSK